MRSGKLEGPMVFAGVLMLLFGALFVGNGVTFFGSTSFTETVVESIPGMCCLGGAGLVVTAFVIHWKNWRRRGKRRERRQEI